MLDGILFTKKCPEGTLSYNMLDHDRMDYIRDNGNSIHEKLSKTCNSLDVNDYIFLQ